MVNKYPNIVKFLKIMKTLYNRMVKNYDNIKIDALQSHMRANCKIGVYTFLSLLSSSKLLSSNDLFNVGLLNDILKLIDDIHNDLKLNNYFLSDFKKNNSNSFHNYFITKAGAGYDYLFLDLFETIETNIYWDGTRQGYNNYDTINERMYNIISDLWWMV